MFNYNNLNKAQTKEFSRYLLDISKACVVGTITLNAITGDTVPKIIFGLMNIFFAFICLDKSMELLKKSK